MNQESSVEKENIDALRAEIAALRAEREKNLTRLEMFDSLLEILPDLVFSVDAEGKYLDAWDPVGGKLFLPKEQLVGKNIKEVLPAPVASKVMTALKKAVETRQLQVIQYNLDVPAGNSWFEARILAHDGKIFSIIRDITKERRANDEQRENNEQLLSIFDNMETLIYVSRVDTYEMLFANARLKEKFGDARGKICYQYLQGRDRPCEFCTNSRLLEDPDAVIKWEFYNPVIERHFLLIDRLIKWTDGTMVRLELATDITTQKDAEQVLLRENERLKQIDDMRKEFVAVATHELKTPLVTIIGASSFLLDHFQSEIPEGAREMIGAVNRGGTRLQALVDNLLDFSRIERGKLDMEHTQFSLVDLLDAALSQIEYMRSQRDSIITRTSTEKDISITGDRVRLEQVVVNLLTNAMKNSPRGSAIAIDAAADPEKNVVLLSVKDEGIGITGEEMEKIFSVFGKLPREDLEIDVDIQGTGLGLFLSKEIVERHGGRIWVVSGGRGKGSTFYVQVPLEPPS